MGSANQLKSVAGLKKKAAKADAASMDILKKALDKKKKA